MLVAEMLGDGRRENGAGAVARGGGWESRRYVAVMEVAVKSEPKESNEEMNKCTHIDIRWIQSEGPMG
jgi:hypothetical protein